MMQIGHSIEGFILAGGASSRMGTDKARLLLGDRTLIERVAGALRGVTRNIAIVASNQKNESVTLRHSPQALPIIADVFQKWGALGGLHAALSAARADWALVVACDLPFVTRDLFVRLASLRADFDAVAPVQADGIPQPLCAFYRTATCRPLSEDLIKGGERRPLTLLQSLRTRWVAFEELSELDGANQFFENLNTPADYARAQRNEQSSSS